MNASAGQPSALRICVFCGARAGHDPAFISLAEQVGSALAQRGHQLVYGGGDVGLMGALAQAALTGGGEVIGVIPRILMAQERGRFDVTRLEVVDSMAARKERMIELADAFLTLPGGLGTLDELFEVLTLRQIGLHRKPIAVLNPDGYFDRLLAALQGFAANGFVNQLDLDTMLVEPTLPALLDRLVSAR